MRNLVTAVMIRDYRNPVKTDGFLQDKQVLVRC